MINIYITSKHYVYYWKLARKRKSSSYYGLNFVHYKSE